MAVPGQPTNAVATPSNKSVWVTWTAPEDDGGQAITSYTVTIVDNTTPGNGGQTAVVANPPVRITGLTAADNVSAKVKATNGAGTGLDSDPSSGVVVLAAGVPTQPQGPSAVAGNAQATVSFSVPEYNGGSAITGYSVLAIDEIVPAHGGQIATGAGSPIVVTGLTNDEGYTFQVRAINAQGNSAYSGKTSLAIPTAVSSTPTTNPFPNATTFPVTKPINPVQLLDEINTAVGGGAQVAIVGESGVPSDQISVTHPATVWVAPDTLNQTTVGNAITAHVANPLYGQPASDAAFNAVLTKVANDPNADLTDEEIQTAVRGLLLQQLYARQEIATP